MIGLIPGFGLPAWATQHTDPPLRPHALLLAGLVAPLVAIGSFIAGSRANDSQRPSRWLIGYVVLWVVIGILIALPLTPAPVHVA